MTQPTQQLPPTVFEILAQQYRDWHIECFGEGDGMPVADDTLRSAKVATFDVAADYHAGDGMFQPGDHILVWASGVVPGPVGSVAVQRLVGWAPALGNDLFPDIQRFAHVIWEQQQQEESDNDDE